MSSRSNKEIEASGNDLQLDEQLPLHKRGWVIQTVGLILIFVIVILAALGMFGNGLLSTTKESRNNTILEYQKFFRHEAVMELKVQSALSESLHVSFPSGYLKDFVIEAIVPEPASNTASNGQIQYNFSGDGHQDVTFYLVPQQAGPKKGSVDINGTRFTLSQFIFP